MGGSGERGDGLEDAKVVQGCSDGRIEIDRTGLPEMGALPKIEVDAMNEGGEDCVPDGTIVEKSPRTPVVDELAFRIGVRGPVTVHDFMSVALSHPLYGYYMKDDILGREGDFVTAPELGQVFGEMKGIWCVATWMELGKPERFKLLEFGPGRGTLMKDLLHAVSGFPDFMKALRLGGGIRMIEISPRMRDLQRKTLKCEKIGGEASFTKILTKEKEEAIALLKEEAGMLSSSIHMDEAWDDEARKGLLYMLIQTRKGDSVPIKWLQDFDDFVKEDDNNYPVIAIANEFFDALPVHQFEFSRRKTWAEKLVDIDSVKETDPEKLKSFPADAPLQKRHQLRFVLSQAATPATRALLKPFLESQSFAGFSVGDQIEVCAAGAAVLQKVRNHLSKSGGSLLIVDYGSEEGNSQSLRGIKGHEFVHPLYTPGHVDLSCDVDFSFFRFVALQDFESLDHPVRVDGPINQGTFLRNLGVETRVATLLQSIEDEDEQLDMYLCMRRLIDGEDGELVPGMGVSFKALSLFSYPRNFETSEEKLRAANLPGFSPVSN